MTKNNFGTPEKNFWGLKQWARCWGGKSGSKSLTQFGVNPFMLTK